MKEYYEKVIDEILTMIKDNLILQYNYNDDALIDIRQYCHNKENSKYKRLDYYTLLFFVEEALAELINCIYLFDLREME